ncbi:zinc finger protein 58-like isoform X2 [Achroia grisella]|uniref:zinc finger protein 58-like isoform X2 n=1 Tax=Achroia grisella TaxID=688607 RepID=UPI0027D27976|nr:zinc finger protein 58-like isoform X2 [Achroia grisella]
MLSDDDLFVVIVDDQLEATSANTKIPLDFEIKEEPIDEEPENIVDVENLLEVASKFGQVEYVLPNNSLIEHSLESNNKLELKGNEYTICVVKQEELSSDHDDVISDIEIEDTDCKDKDYHPDIELESDDDSKKPVIRVLKPDMWKSYVDVLRKKFPKLRRDSAGLINALVEVMKVVKRPQPPPNYFVMNESQYQCVKCGALTKTNPAAWLHYQEKHGKRYLTCFACGMTFRSTTNLYKHEKLCPAPDATIVLKARALTLGRKGRGRPFLPKFDTKKAVSQKRYPCNLCPAVFNSKFNLRSHEHLHRGERPYRCHSCPAAYTGPSALRRHIAKHSNIKYTCDHCKREFVTKTNLVTHMDTHLPEPRFACESCPRRYATRAALRLHQRRVHLQLPPPCACQLCPRRYPRMSVLKNHMRKVHGMILMTRRMFFKQLPTLPDAQLAMDPNDSTPKIKIKINDFDDTELILNEQTGFITGKHISADEMLAQPVSYIFTKMENVEQNGNDRKSRKRRKKRNDTS